MRAPVRDARSRAAGELNMTPMIDVVFLLIIFFLVSSHLARRESRLALDLPTAATGQADDDPSPRLTINVAADGALSLGAEAIDPTQLTERLRAQSEAEGDALRVRLRSDRAAPYSAVEPALAACAEAGVEDIALAVYGKEARR
ncbi:ExbD/TolR family protein [Botrimarina mediterranea]|uniref:Biopolymer transport protein ExbD n=1 Tax=Botrimarina mediterranea TaxID=2528022 RepID=A0A518KDZ1_9BACT|nr:biopolymer transporter ExbD [Botrimarina mediterranea]QDV76012.1 Biopolymer transport protein ExbD [Botrimarina mediterranea]